MLCHMSPKSGSVLGSAIRKYLQITKSSGKCNLQHVPDLQLPLGSGTLPPGTQIPKLSQGTGLSEMHLFQTKMDQKDPPNLVFALDNTFSGVGTELDIHSGRGGFPLPPSWGHHKGLELMTMGTGICRRSGPGQWRATSSRRRRLRTIGPPSIRQPSRVCRTTPLRGICDKSSG